MYACMCFLNFIQAWFPRYWISGNKGQWSGDLGNNGGESYYFPVSLPWTFPGCSAGIEGPQKFLQYLWIKEIGLRASEIQTSRVQILKYLEERTAQTKISELLNIVIFEYSADQHMKEKKLSEAGAKKNIRVWRPKLVPILTSQTRKSSWFLGRLVLSPRRILHKRVLPQ